MEGTNGDGSREKEDFEFGARVKLLIQISLELSISYGYIELAMEPSELLACTILPASHLLHTRYNTILPEKKKIKNNNYNKN